MLTEINLPQVAQTLDYSCGAACFESMFRYLGGRSLGEMHFAKLLGTLELGYTPPEKISELAKSFGYAVNMKRGAEFSELQQAFENRQVIFVTWWFEDSGHYSLVRKISDTEITLMDPWLARDNLDHTLNLTEFQEFWKTRGSVFIGVSE